MKKLFALLLAMLMVLSLFTGCGGSTSGTAAPSDSGKEPEAAEETKEPETPDEPEEPEIEYTYSDSMDYYPGDMVDDFQVELCDGTVVTLHEMLATHKIVMINVWATWCTPCKMEFPIMNEAWDMYQDEVALVCLSPYDSNEEVAAFKEENGLTLPMGADTIGADLLVQEGYPTTIIIDSSGCYVYYECGSITDISGFTRMWDLFLAEDYVPGTVYSSVPGPMYEGEVPADEALTAALCLDGTVTFCSDTADEYAWPFLPAEAGAVNSDPLVANSYAVLYATVEAKAGDVFSIDYAMDIENYYDSMEISLDGELVKTLAVTKEGTWLYCFEEDGTHELCFRYLSFCSAGDTESSGEVLLSNASLLTGEAAAEALKNQPVFQYQLEGDDYILEVISESAKRIVIDDPAGYCADYLAGIEFWLIPEDTGLFRMQLGDAYDPDMAYGYGDYDYVVHPISACEFDGIGYVFETELSSVEAGSYCDTYVSLYPDAFDYNTGTTVFVFKNEENVNYFLRYDLAPEPVPGVFWTYEDGTLPSTDAIAKEPSEFLYNIYLVDENGDPVDGVMINVCTDETCTPSNTESGFFGFNGDPFAYVIHVLKVPDGYAFDTTQEFVMDAEGDTLVITIPHA